MAATQQGVVIAANWWGKAKTIVQVAAIFFLIAFDPTPLWVDLLVYGAVAITIISGVDYFFGLRRMLREADERRAARPSRSSERGQRPRVEPLAHRRVVREVLAGGQLVAQLAEQAEALGDDVVLVDRLQVLLAGGDERASPRTPKRVDHAAHHLAHAVLDEARAPVGLLDDGALVGALHQLVDLGAHRLLDDLQQHLRVEVGVAVLGAADVQRAEPALVVRRDRHVRRRCGRSRRR